MKNSLTQAVAVLRPFFCENCAPWFSTKKSAFLVSRMQNHFWLIVCNKSAHKSGGMQQQQKQPFSIQHIAAHSICRSKYLNKFFWLPTKHYLNFLLLLLFLFFLKITLMHICYFSKRSSIAFFLHAVLRQVVVLSALTCHVCEISSKRLATCLFPDTLQRTRKWKRSGGGKIVRRVLLRCS